MGPSLRNSESDSSIDRTAHSTGFNESNLMNKNAGFEGRSVRLSSSRDESNYEQENSYRIKSEHSLSQLQQTRNTRSNTDHRKSVSSAETGDSIYQANVYIRINLKYLPNKKQPNFNLIFFL